MNILIITTQLPWPLNSGGAQAQFNMIDELRKVHNITIVFQQDRKNTLANMEQLAQIWTDVTFKPYYYKWQLRNPRFIYNKVKRGFGAFVTPNCQDFQFDVALRSICIMRTGRLKKFLADIISSQKIDIVQIEFFPAIDLVFDLPATVKKSLCSMRYITKRMSVSLNASTLPHPNKRLSMRANHLKYGR